MRVAVVFFSGKNRNTMMGLAKALARGIYFVRLATPDQTLKVKTVLAR